MRIAQLQLVAFGPFRGLELDFAAPGIHLVLGRNEAGKSTTLRAIGSLLYGIDTNTQDAHLHKPSELRVGGVLTGDDGTRLRVVRRKSVSKGGPNTLLDEHGAAMDEAVLQRLLRGVSEETFRHAFGLDHETLAEGARALLAGRGDIAGSLFDASVGGGGDVRALLAELQSEAEGIYKPRGSTQPLNVALKAFGDLQKSVREKERLPAAFVAQRQALDEGLARHQELVASRLELARRRTQIDGARRRIPLERRRAQAIAALAELVEVAKHAPRIASLHGRLAGYELAKAAHHDATLGAERLRVSVGEAARRAGVPAAAKDLRIDVRTQSRIGKHVQERAALHQRLETARVELTRNERDLAKLAAEKAAPDGPDATDEGAVAALGRALAEARKLGDAASQLVTMTARAARRRADVEAKAAALGGFTGSLEELVALRPPPAAALEGLAARATELDRGLTRLAERIESFAAETRTAEQQLAAASGDFAPPTRDDLRVARAARDLAWNEVQSARNAEADAAFVRALQQADGLADRMIVEADRVTTLARYRAQLGTLATQAAAAEAERAQRLAERRTLDDEHRRLWSDAGISADTTRASSLAEMREWLGKHAQIAEAFTTVGEAEADAREYASRLDVATQALATALAQDGSPALAGASLSSLVDRAAARLERLERARHEATATANRIVKLEAELEERRSALLRDEAALAEAQTKLAQLVAPLGIPDDADADEVTQSLEALRELFSLEDQRAELETRAASSGKQVASFDEEAALAAATLGADLVGLAASAIASELAARSRRAQEAETQRADADQLLAELVVDGETVPDDILEIVADADGASRALEEVDEQLTELDAKLQSVTRANVGIEVGLEQMRGDSGAAEASALAQEALARVRSELDRYVRAKAAAVLLAREIDRYREENQGPLLTKASQLFARLTLGSFSGVRAGYDEKDRPALRCVREGSVEVDVTGLSEGTRDQLYLSLRLASLLRYADMAEPMPLVLDDVLIQFDDERSRAALGVIAEVATRMQVLFFTHHTRMVDLARAAVPAAALTVHELVAHAPPATAPVQGTFST